MFGFPGSKLFVGMIAAVLAVCLIGAAGCGGQEGPETPDGSAEQPTLFAYVGANLKGPVLELAEAFEAETGVPVELTFQNAGALLNQIETMRKGDIYMPGGMNFAERAQEQGHVERIIAPIAYHTPVIVAPKDNPAGIAAVQDLANPGVELVVPDLEATAIGKKALKVFENVGLRTKIENNITATLESPAKVLAAITMGQGDAGIVEFSNTVNHGDELTIIEIDPALNVVDEIPIMSLVYSENKESAEEFMQYVEQNGPKVFGAHGFKTP